MITIPLHSLVITVGPSGAGKSMLLGQRFPRHEIVSSDAIREELVGDLTRQDVTRHVFDQLKLRVGLKLSLGERAIVDATNIITRDRVSLAEIGLRAGVPVFYLVVNRPLSDKRRSGGWRNQQKYGDKPLMTHHEEIFLKNERDILAGDGMAEVIDTRREDFTVVARFDLNNLVDEAVERGFSGFAVIGDTHNVFDKMKAAVDAATGSNYLCVLLGDIIDYGPNPVECIDLAYETVMTGRGLIILGNHERKIIKYYEQQIAALEEGYEFNEVEPSVKLSSANLATIRVINNQPEPDRLRLIKRFLALSGQSRMHLHAGNLTFVHGAAHRSLYGLNEHRLRGAARDFAYFGQTDGFHPRDEFGNVFPNRIYNWVDDIPATQIVFVGHDVRSSEPLVVANKKGGQAVFLDTGCGKQGTLSMAFVPFSGNALLRVERFSQF